MATHSSILAWRNPGTDEPGGLPSMGLHSVGHGWSDLACMHAMEKEMETHSSVPAWRITGAEEPGGLPSEGLHRVTYDWHDLAAAAAAAYLKRMVKTKTKTPLVEMFKRCSKGVKTIKWGKQSMKQDMLTKLNIHQQKKILTMQRTTVQPIAS